MAKFDKNMKNDFLSDDVFEDEYYDDEAADSDSDYEGSEEFQDYSDSEDESLEEEESASETEPEEQKADITVEKPDDGPEAKWYVVHTYSDYENKVKINIEKMVENRGMQDLIRSIVIPMEDVLEETKSGERKVKKRKLFPGYVIVNMVMTSESWYLIRNTQGVTGFVGHGSDPIPLSDEEVRRMGIERTTIKVDFEVGDRIKITDGPYKDYMLIVEEIDTAKQKVKGKLGHVTMEIPFELVEKMA
ncbi:MAG: transcription termination/antitermination protein NusG [Anaerovoracaceae bacterium]|jgi:transcriptional antiterminator NusG